MTRAWLLNFAHTSGTPDQLSPWNTVRATCNYVYTSYICVLKSAYILHTHTHTHARTHARTHTHTHTHIHTHTHTHCTNCFHILRHRWWVADGQTPPPKVPLPVHLLHSPPCLSAQPAVGEYVCRVAMLISGFCSRGGKCLVQIRGSQRLLIYSLQWVGISMCVCVSVYVCEHMCVSVCMHTFIGNII